MREPRDDQTEAIAAVQEAGGHLLSLVNDVLDIARIESGRETFALEPVALEATVEEGVRLVAPSARGRPSRSGGGWRSAPSSWPRRGSAATSRSRGRLGTAPRITCSPIGSGSS